MGVVEGLLSAGDVTVDTTGEVSSNSIFQIGSVRKVFTALLLADAVSRGEVALDMPLAACLPGTTVPGPITLEHLATHSSGLPRLPPGLRRDALRHRMDPYRDVTADTLLSALSITRLRSVPGARVRYSNFGAALLGEALSRQLGRTYADLVTERITGPLGMTETGVHLGDGQDQRRAIGHSRWGRPVPDWQLGAMVGAGALYSTARDLLALLQAHLEPDATVLPDALRLVQQRRVRSNRRLQIGLGWLLSPLGSSDTPMLWHNGRTGGFSSFIALVPKPGAACVVLADAARAVERRGLRSLATAVRDTRGPAQIGG